ncbi:hypothetical protein F4814DRAFT_407726 [Daldinia grandis]|nr:hypothetical protein F4814DRAFT_407726 [Daldinia grandis]
MSNICTALEAHGASHTSMAKANIKFCQFCGVFLSRIARTRNKGPGKGVITISNDEDSAGSSTILVKKIPHNKSQEIDNLTAADKVSSIHRRPAPPPLVLKTEYNLVPATQIPASSEAAKRSARRAPPSTHTWYYFNINVCYTKWVSDENDDVPYPTFIHNSLKILHNYNTAVRSGKVANINDWWKGYASQNFERKRDLDRKYSITFYKNLTKKTFTSLNEETQNAQDVRTIWDSLPPAKSQDGREYRKIFITYRNIQTVPKFKDELTSPGAHTNIEDYDEGGTPDIRTKIENDDSEGGNTTLVKIENDDSEGGSTTLVKIEKSNLADPVIKHEAQDNNPFVQT